MKLWFYLDSLTNTPLSGWCTNKIHLIHSSPFQLHWLRMIMVYWSFSQFYHLQKTILDFCNYRGEYRTSQKQKNTTVSCLVYIHIISGISTVTEKGRLVLTHRPVPFLNGWAIIPVLSSLNPHIWLQIGFSNLELEFHQSPNMYNKRSM